MVVKICGITSLEDAQAAAEAGATALGFNFYRGSPRYLAPERAASLLAAAPASIWRVGVFVNEPAEQVRRLAACLGLDVVQLHGETAQAPTGLRVWRAVQLHPALEVAALEDPQAEAFLLDAAPPAVWGGSGICFDWRLVRGGPRKIIIAGGLDATNVREAVRQARPWGVDACSRLESAPGRKDHARVRAFVRAALEAASANDQETA